MGRSEGRGGGFWRDCSVALLIATSVIGCSSGSTDQTSNPVCAAIAPCGGEIAGTWHVQDFCSAALSNPPSIPGCPSAVTKITSVAVSGTVTYNTDGSTRTDLQGVITESGLLPLSCITQPKCAGFAAELVAGGGVTSANCNYEASSGCACSLRLEAGNATTGKYRVSGSTLTITTDGDPSPAETDQFCVSGSELKVQFPDTDGSITVFTATR